MIPFLKDKTKKEKTKYPERADFLGQALVSDVVGFGRRADITYGRKRTAKLAEADVRLSGKRYGRFSSERKITLIAKTRPSLTKPFKRQGTIRL